VLFALAVSFQVKANHQQITYYLGLMLILYAVVLLVWLLTCERAPFDGGAVLYRFCFAARGGVRGYRYECQ
jgi:hypothetical protein